MTLDEKYDSVRKRMLAMLSASGSGHVGSSLSCLHILVALHFRIMDSHDLFVLSKGHAAPALYAVLQERGLYQTEKLRSAGSAFQGHPDVRYLPECHVSTGSLGQGCSMATGIAMGRKLRAKDGLVYVLLGDGECQEGQIWEALLFANHHHLENLVLLIDQNRIQHDGFTENILSLGSISEKFRSFGISCQEANGHHFDEIERALATRSGEGPSAVVFHTQKGHGFAGMQDNPHWHSIKDPVAFRAMLSERNLL